jgi:hypothetical protein
MAKGEEMNQNAQVRGREPEPEEPAQITLKSEVAARPVGSIAA